ncbi:MAG: phosphatase PAP2 family protein [Gaiella sp.]
MLRSWLSHTHSGLREILGLAGLYGAYEVVRGFGGEDYAVAFANTADIVALEQRLGVFVERTVQESVSGLAGVPALLGAAYMLLHFVGTAALVVWVHRARPDAYPIVRTTLVASTALALVGYVLYPAAPPRLADLGFVDTVSASTGLNLSSDLLGSLYNPIAAVPSLHFGYAVIVGVALATLARTPLVRLTGAAYPAVMLFVIVATGNHFFLDAAAGGLTVVLGWITARSLVGRKASAHGRNRTAGAAGPRT